MVTINVMTPLSRPFNIPAMYASMWHIDRDMRVRWIVVADSHDHPDVLGRLPAGGDHPYIEIITANHHNPSTGHAQRNFALDKLTVPGYVYWLDDDNILHPGFLGRFRALAMAGWKGMLFGQDRTEGYVAPDLRHIDTGQIVVHTELIGETRWGLHYTADGDFIREVYEKDPDAFIIVNDELTYHNRLRRGEV